MAVTFFAMRGSGVSVPLRLLMVALIVLVSRLVMVMLCGRMMGSSHEMMFRGWMLFFCHDQILSGDFRDS